MEVLKKTIKQAVTTGATTGCTGTTCYVIIPDLTAVYYMNICLKQTLKDWGFFDPFPVEVSEPEEESDAYTDSNGDIFTDYNDDIFIF